MLNPKELCGQLNMASQITTIAEGEQESDNLSLVFEDDRMLIMMGEFDHIFQTEDPDKAVAIAALILQWASRNKRLKAPCACDEHGKVCMFHLNIDAAILQLVNADGNATMGGFCL